MRGIADELVLWASAKLALQNYKMENETDDGEEEDGEDDNGDEEGEEDEDMDYEENTGRKGKKMSGFGEARQEVMERKSRNFYAKEEGKKESEEEQVKSNEDVNETEAGVAMDDNEEGEEMSDETRSKLFIRDEMEECDDVKKWIESRIKGKDRWVNMIVDQTTGMRYRWKKEHKKFEEQVTTAEKDGNFWYAKWGIYNILAAREGTEAAVRLRKMKESMKTKESVHIGKGKGRV